MNKIALITGGSRGIGLGIATSLARSGWSLAINGMRNIDEVDTLAGLRELGSKVIYCQGDISKTEDRVSILQNTMDAFGSIHVLVNNAGVAPVSRRDLLDISEESYDRVLNTNLRGPFFLTQLVAKEMIRGKEGDAEFKGCIINISSISATVVSTERGQYCISKAGMSMLTQLFAVRLGAYDIPVFEIRPGIIATDMTVGVQAKYDSKIASGLTVSKRWGLPADVGKVVAGLVSGGFGYSTGQVISVDGGLTIPRL